MQQKPVIFHIDFDSYFVSASRAKDPNLNNKPIAIARSSAHAIAVSVSYELKRSGVKAGMKVYEIRSIEPRTIFVNSDMDYYVQLSNQIFTYIASEFSGNISISSIDECFLDVSEIVYTQNIEPRKLAAIVQSQILNIFSIPITIGISHNRFLAKMTTNISKPFGIGYTDEKNYKEHFFNLDIEQFHGIGKKIAKKLREVNINTIGDLSLRDQTDMQLNAIFGRTTREYLSKLDPNIYEHVVFKETQPAGIGNEITFDDYDLDMNEKINKLKEMCKKVALRADVDNLAGNVVTLTIRFRDKRWISKQHKISDYINDVGSITKIALKIFNENQFDERNFIGVGVRLSGLKSVFDIFRPISLFETNSKKEISRVDKLITKINQKMHNNSVMTLSEYAQKQKKEKIKGKYSVAHAVYRK
ncbi:DNA polymerase IV [Mycoplasma sp. Pen4]|uniref:Y-family DNA polymerase n=1 Tax=Mycoplasma sp. Pen4 TaxID=640330 RepID=UPI00165462E4|nr:DNA polymerase IV [Mycoplasma sp. Pen4]QNM93900.1 DNA polymerase IV [Mycoplasma sp. Pen4]